MNKAIKWGLIICVGLVVLVIATLLIAPAFIDNFRRNSNERLSALRQAPQKALQSVSLTYGHPCLRKKYRRATASPRGIVVPTRQ